MNKYIKILSTFFLILIFFILIIFLGNQNNMNYDLNNNSGEQNTISGDVLDTIESFSGDILPSNNTIKSGEEYSNGIKYIDFLRGDEIITYKTDKYILNYYNVKDKDIYWTYIENPEIIINKTESIPVIDCYAVLLDHYYNNEILTIIVSGLESNYTIYNIEINTLQFLNNEDILKLVGMSLEDMKNIVLNTTTELIDKLYNGNELQEALNYYEMNKDKYFEKYVSFFFDNEQRFSFKSWYPKIKNETDLDFYFYNYEGGYNYFYNYNESNLNYLE